MERKIGEIFEHNGEWYQCIPDTTDDNCNNCFFQKRCSNITGDCSSTARSDGKSVAFKKLEKVGEPFYRRWTLEGNNKLMQRYKTYTTPLITIDKQRMFYNLTDDLLEIEIKQTKEDMKEKKLNLKPFDIQKAREGKPVCTRDGHKVRIVCFDKIDSTGLNLHIVALIQCEETEVLRLYRDDGKRDAKVDLALDLMMLPEKKEGWAVIRKGDIYETEELARKELLDSQTAMMIRKISWEE